MANLSKKKIWFKVVRKDIETAKENSEEEVFSHEITEDQSGEKIRQDVMCKCNLADLDNVIFKLRNHRGSLIPFTWNIPVNSNANAYTLEVVKVHQYVKANPRSIKISCYDDTMNEKVAEILIRIEKLESMAPELDKKRELKINQEMTDVEQMLTFLTKRMQDSEQAHWQGMFKKNPLW